MEKAKLSVKGFAVAGAITWAISVLFVGLCNMKWPGYGDAFLDFVSSVYPGYLADGTLKSVLIGTGYAIVDGAIGGVIFALIYNCASCCKMCKK